MATEQPGVTATPTSTVPMIIRDNSAVPHVLIALNSRPVRPTALVLLATVQTSAVRCQQWTATTTRTSAVKRAQLTTLALKVTCLHITVGFNPTFSNEKHIIVYPGSDWVMGARRYPQVCMTGHGVCLLLEEYVLVRGCTQPTRRSVTE